MARQMGVPMGIQMNVREANILFLIFTVFIAYDMITITHQDSEHCPDFAHTMFSPISPVTVPPFSLWQYVVFQVHNTKQWARFDTTSLVL